MDIAEGHNVYLLQFPSQLKQLFQLCKQTCMHARTHYCPLFGFCKHPFLNWRSSGMENRKFSFLAPSFPTCIASRQDTCLLVSCQVLVHIEFFHVHMNIPALHLGARMPSLCQHWMQPTLICVHGHWRGISGLDCLTSTREQQEGRAGGSCRLDQATGHDIAHL